MARVRIPNELALTSWEDVDLSLKEIGEHQIEIEKIEAEMNTKISDMKLEAEILAKPFKESIKKLERQIKDYTDENREDLGDKKTRFANFGKLGYRKSTKISLPRAAKKVAELIGKLKQAGMDDCIIQPPEKINKDNLKKYPQGDILKVGAGLKIDDVFWYEVDRERLSNE